MAEEAPEFEDAADELYGLHPDRFVPRRTELVKAAKVVKDKETATAIGALRKPSLGAWLANVLARESPDEVGALEELGGQLRQAQETLSGDALRALTSQRRELVGALVARARKLAREDGEKVGDAVARDLEQTIAAALADPEAARAFAAGRLTTALEPGVGFTGGSTARAAGGTTRRPPPRGASQTRPAPRRRDPGPEPEPDGPDPEEEERERAREAAERAVERAREERDDTARAAERARHRAEQAASDHDEAAAAAQSLRERLARAEADETAAREALDAARQAAEEADTAADEARRALDQAEAERADLE
ncbi:hypothetical protein [Actinomycetospora sp. NBRC 106378]|uniref:hypothetical protein n=1 Tax=Actinomycetospora sp. NBRC 106378 TaxID=3032208 RepID=UPI0024A16237|nr:hypothetical protein [Actinomycetospora sp. NBRC 106378]GLZ54159.1 hypothetical protein Acsp07_37760 [Actinomycetospora sp. NBRC 106378]